MTETPQPSTTLRSPARRKPPASAVTSVRYVSAPTGEKVSVSGVSTSAVRQTLKVVYETAGVPIQGILTPLYKTLAGSGAKAHLVVHLTPETPAVQVALPPNAADVVSTVPHRTSPRDD